VKGSAHRHLTAQAVDREEEGRDHAAKDGRGQRQRGADGAADQQQRLRDPARAALADLRSAATGQREPSDSASARHRISQRCHSLDTHKQNPSKQQSALRGIKPSAPAIRGYCTRLPLHA
jgi:hypothetical protein